MAKEIIATIGVFDGLHRGHQALIDELKILSMQKNMIPLVITFSNKPSAIIDPQRSNYMLSTPKEKKMLIKNLGIENVKFIDFDYQIAKLSAQEFLLELSKKYPIKALIMGYDHCFGSDKLSDIQQYQQIGKTLGIEIIKSNQKITDNDIISSSLIRHLISRGEIKKANTLLGYNYTLSGKVIEGMRIGRTMGFPTANIEPELKNKLLPAHGVYAVFAIFDNQKYPAMLYIGRRPTLDDGRSITIEVNIFDININLYSKEIKIEFLEFIREDCKFKDLSELKNRIAQDEIEVRKVLSNYF